MATVESIKKAKKKRHGGKITKIVLSVVLLALLSVIAAVLVTNNGKLNADGFLRLFDGDGEKMQTDEFVFDGGNDKDVAAFGAGLAVASATGLQIIDRHGDTTFSETFRMETPTVCIGGDAGAAYDLGGNDIVLFDASGIIKSISTSGKIISARLNADGWLALCTQESGYKGLVTVYNDKGSEEYYWYSASGYPLSAEVSPNNRELAALTLTNDGSKIVFFELDSDDEKTSLTFSEKLVTEITYIETDSVLAVSEDMLSIVNNDGTGETLMDYTGKYLAGYSIDSDNFTALILNDYLVGNQGSIVTVDRTGAVLGTISTDREVLALSANGDYLAVLSDDGLFIYDKNLEQCACYEDTTGADGAIMRSDGTALYVTAHSAQVRNSIAE